MWDPLWLHRLSHYDASLGYNPIKLYLLKQIKGWIWSMGQFANPNYKESSNNIYFWLIKRVLSRCTLSIYLLTHASISPCLCTMAECLYAGPWPRISSRGGVTLAIKANGPTTTGSALSTSHDVSLWLPLRRQKKKKKKAFLFLFFFTPGNFVLIFPVSVLDFWNTFKDHFWNKHTVIFSEACQPLISSCWLSKNRSCHFYWVFREAFVVSGIFLCIYFHFPKPELSSWWVPGSGLLVSIMACFHLLCRLNDSAFLGVDLFPGGYRI